MMKSSLGVEFKRFVIDLFHITNVLKFNCCKCSNILESLKRQVTDKRTIFKDFKMLSSAVKMQISKKKNRKF